ncbi:MAG: ribonuclease III [Lachnospiraceae bacterium]|jgi:ribonuclease-3 family protein|nr:ribonuclease III [Lachnospiraceae bacterium]MBQ5474905.1 ribonuclease III [Lachnospiraceae bacterium]
MAENLINDLLKTIEIKENVEIKDINTYSPLTLAYIGDAIYELIIRTMVISKGDRQVGKLHKESSELVKASTQAEISKSLKDILTEEEERVFKRGRNAKSFTTAKNASMSDYRTATGFEALMGYLYLSHQSDRMLELINTGLKNINYV